MTDLLSKIQRDINSRLSDLRPLVSEAEHLERALAALNASERPSHASAQPTRRRARRASGSTRRGDTTARVVEYLKAHPRSTAGTVAAALGMNPRSTSTRLTQMAKAGDIKKETRGYSA
jgi:hypothetical protein